MDKEIHIAIIIGYSYFEYCNIVMYFNEINNTFESWFSKTQIDSRHCGQPVIFEKVVNALDSKIIPIDKVPVVNEDYKFQKHSYELFDDDLFYEGELVQLNIHEKIIILQYFHDKDIINAINAYEDKIRECKDLFLSHPVIQQEIEKEVDSIDLNKLLEGLSVKVEEHFITKVGDDDSYYVTKEVAVKNQNNVQIDEYLKDLIQLGKRKIHSERGYTSAYNMRIPDLITGNYNEEQCQLEKKRILAKYDRTEHIQTLLRAKSDTIYNPLFGTGISIDHGKIISSDLFFIYTVKHSVNIRKSIENFGFEFESDAEDTNTHLRIIDEIDISKLNIRLKERNRIIQESEWTKNRIVRYNKSIEIINGLISKLWRSLDVINNEKMFPY